MWRSTDREHGSRRLRGLRIGLPSHGLRRRFASAASFNNGVVCTVPTVPYSRLTKAIRASFSASVKPLKRRRTGAASPSCHWMASVTLAGAAVVQKPGDLHVAAEIPERRGAPFAGLRRTLGDPVVQTGAHVVEQQIGVGGDRLAVRQSRGWRDRARSRCG